MFNEDYTSISIWYSIVTSVLESDVGTTLSAITSDGDSTAGNDTIRVKFTTTSDSSTAVTMEYQIEILV